MKVIFPVSENEIRGIEDARFVHFFNGDLIIPYSMSDTSSGIAVVPVEDLLSSMLNNRTN